MTAHPECPYCGATTGLRIECQGDGLRVQTDYICADCFRGADDGPSFDDLPAVQPDPFPALMAYVMFGRLP